MSTTLELLVHHAEDVNRLAQIGSLNSLSDEVGPSQVQTDRERVETLRQLKDSLSRMWWADSFPVLRAAEVLANTSRSSEWRLPLGESGVLDFFLEVISDVHVPNELLLSSLRLIGNACAETDENRQYIIDQDHLGGLVGRLRGPLYVDVVLTVIYNICLDYPIDDGVIPALTCLLGGQGQAYDRDVVRSICRLMRILIELGTDHSPDGIVRTLLQTAAIAEAAFDEFLALVDLAVAHLTDARFQQLLVKGHELEALLAVLVESYSRFSISTESSLTSSDLESTMVSTQTIRPEDAERLSSTRDQVVQVLADISAMPEFASLFALHLWDCPLLGSLRLWLSVPQSQLRVSASLMLGNLARTDEACRVMVHQHKLHEPLIQILRESQELPLLHAAAGFLKNLMHLAANKDVIGQARLLEAIVRLWNMRTSPQMQYTGALLARQAVNGSNENIRRLLTPLSLDPDSPAHSRTYLSLLLHLCHETDQPSIKTEIARIIAAILRVLNAPLTFVPSGDQTEMQGRLYSLHPDLARPLAHLACQSERSVVRSEAWFALALMARSKEGAVIVDDALSEIEVFQVLVENVAGKPMIEGQSPDVEATSKPPRRAEDEPDPTDEIQSSEDGKRIDRENGLVLITQLLANRGDDIPDMRRQALQNLLQINEFLHQSFGQIIASTSTIPSDDHSRDMIDNFILPPPDPGWG